MLRVSLVLASGPGFPEGSADWRYEMSVRLDGHGRMSPEQWNGDAAPWPARRWCPGEPPREGTVQHDQEGGWSLHFDARPDLPDDHALHCPLLSAPNMRPGEYVTVQEPDGVEFAYRIVNVT